MRTTKHNLIVQPTRSQSFLADSGENWAIWRDTVTRTYQIIIRGACVGSRGTLAEAQTLRREREG